MPRFVPFALAFSSVVVCGATLEAQEPADPPPLHSEKGLHATIEVELRGHFHRLVLNGTLWGTQFNDKFRRHWADDLTWPG